VRLIRLDRGSDANEFLFGPEPTRFVAHNIDGVSERFCGLAYAIANCLPQLLTLNVHGIGHFLPWHVGQGVRCPSPCVMNPLPPHCSQTAGAGFGGTGFCSGARSCAVEA
jgi:hypothetical protein